MELAAVLLEFGNAPNLQILPNPNITEIKSITSIAIIPTQYRKLNKYVTYYNDPSYLTLKIIGNKPR